MESPRALSDTPLAGAMPSCAHPSNVRDLLGGRQPEGYRGIPFMLEDARERTRYIGVAPEPWLIRRVDRGLAELSHP